MTLVEAGTEDGGQAMTQPASNNRSRKLWLVIALAIFLGVLLFAARIYYNHSNSPIEEARRMVKSGELSGQPVDQVFRHFDTLPSTRHFLGWDAAIRLGDSTGLFPIDSTWLVIKVDDQDRVVEADVIED